MEVEPCGRAPMRYAIARILEGKTSAPETQFLGTAFAVSDELALTAFHCIGDRSSNRVSLDRVKLLFPDNELVDAEYRGGDGRLDYAVLRLQLAPSKSLTRVSITPDTFREEQFFSSGYPAQIIETEFFTVTGVVSDPGAALRGECSRHPTLQPGIRSPAFPSGHEWRPRYGRRSACCDRNCALEPGT